MSAKEKIPVTLRSPEFTKRMVVVCDICETEVLELNRDSFIGDLITEDLFKPLNGTVLKMFEKILCPKCGSDILNPIIPRDKKK